MCIIFISGKQITLACISLIDFAVKNGNNYRSKIVKIFPTLWQIPLNCMQNFSFTVYLVTDTSLLVIGVSLSEPHHVRSTVNFVFLLACLYACHRLIWFSATKSTLKAL